MYSVPLFRDTLNKGCIAFNLALHRKHLNPLLECSYSLYVDNQVYQSTVVAIPISMTSNYSN